MRKAMSVIALVGAVCVAAQKVYQGELPNFTELQLVVFGVAAAFGFQAK